MSFKEKNIAVTLVNFSLIMGFFLIRVLDMIQNDSFNQDNVFQLWLIVAIMAVVVTIIATILTHATPVIIKAIQTGEKDVEIDDLEDERDKLIDLRGTKITYTISSLGSGLAMFSFVLGQSPLVMFTLLMFFGVLAQIIGDVVRLLIYRGTLA